MLFECQMKIIFQQPGGLSKCNNLEAYFLKSLCLKNNFDTQFAWVLHWDSIEKCRELLSQKMSDILKTNFTEITHLKTLSDTWKYYDIKISADQNPTQHQDINPGVG